jgi:hypothetical protein
VKYIIPWRAWTIAFQITFEDMFINGLIIEKNKVFILFLYSNLKINIK